MKKQKSNTRFVVVRSYYAGVHVGELVEHSPDGKCVTLTDANRIWSWEGALSLSEVSQRGIKGGKIGCLVPRIVLSEACEIIDANEKAIKTVRALASKDATTTAGDE